MRYVPFWYRFWSGVNKNGPATSVAELVKGAKFDKKLQKL